MKFGMKNLRGWLIVFAVGLGAVLLSGCAWGAPLALGALLVALLVAGWACGAASSPHNTEDEEACGDGICPDFMTCVDTVEHGEWCLPDADRDELWDGQDNCPYLANTDQTDEDDDGVGDGCDLCEGPNALSPCGEDCCTDADGDGVAGISGHPRDSEHDNCPWISNPDQSDRDHDNIGDACDLLPDDADVLSPCGYPDIDSDGDGVSEWGNCDGDPVDLCPFVPSDRLDDADGDSIPDVCDPDGIAPVSAEEASLDLRRRMMLEELRNRGVLDDETVRLALSIGSDYPALG